MLKNVKRLVAVVLAALFVGGPHLGAASDPSVQAGVYLQQISSSVGALYIKSTAGPGIVSDNGSVVFNQRFRVTVADVNTGATLLAAIPGYKYRLISCNALAVGGAAGAVTTVDILATQATSSVKLVAYAQASLTQSAVLKDGGTGAAVLADGASYVQNDVNTAITIGKTGSSVTTATHIDVVISYAIES